MKLTNQLINEILRKKIYDCSKDELAAILKLLGCQVKEFTARGATDAKSEHKAISFEVHHGLFFVMEVEGDNSNRIVSYNNEWVMENGVAMPTDNLAVALQMVINYFLPKMPFNYEGPRYIEGREYDYDSMDEMQALLEHLQSEWEVVLAEVSKADEERQAKREKTSNVEVGYSTIKQLLPNIVGELDERKMKLFIEALSINELQPGFVTGVRGEDGKLYGEDKGEGTVLGWADFLECGVKVGNINL